ncbi:uncharacterized protein LTR77_000387 [Saxophila tyrrhenica]|uniref:RRM domain-containing protein n=1 Tax=Saxophila tyrrhenica TaxID=1690608 RepID=A0AAV9PSD3_9PEZI|nr:hypothetical protein LTR77_000387 [Saxophila tyrrhenica]
MADACPGVIVSSNRYADVEPYATNLYRVEPLKWGAVFPWQFPQNATRQEEEAFLNTHFSPDEIYMQGGAHGEGKGYRFLKQVFYTVAIYNLETRVPAVEQWFWQQPANFGLLNDLSMRQFLFADGAAPSTFFEAHEMRMYGNEFLTVVVPRIQETARVYLAQQEVNKDINILDVSRNVTQNIHDTLRCQLERAAQAKEANNEQASNARISTKQPAIVSSQPSASPIVTLPDRSRDVSGEHSNSHGMPTRLPRQGGYANNSRFNGRSGHYDTRSRNPSDDHTTYSHHVPMDGPQPMPPQGYRAGPSEFMPAIPQGQQLNAMQQQYQSASSQHQPQPQMPLYDPTAAPVHQTMPPMNAYTPGQQTFFYNTNASGVPGGAVVSGGYAHGNNGTRGFENGSGDRGKDRRNSASNRGRGYNSMRGRGSRGRNSFGSTDAVPYGARGDNFAQRGGNAAGSSQRARRQSGMSDSWRSGSDRPQTQVGQMPTGENMPPNRAFSASDNFQPAPMNHHGGRGSFNQFYGPTHHNYQVMDCRPQDLPGPPPGLASLGDSMQAHKSRNNPGVPTCGQDWILPEDTTVKKLIVFDIPGEIPKPILLEAFNQYGKVDAVSRSQSKPWQGTQYAKPFVFLIFPTSQAARDFFYNKPETWLGGIPCKVEVAREFYGPNWQDKPPASMDHSASFADKRKDSITVTEEQFTPRILQRGIDETFAEEDSYTPGSVTEQQTSRTASRDTTPSPSGENTPKKKNKSKSKKAASLKKSSNNLLKKSVAASADHKAQSETAADSDAVTCAKSGESVNVKPDHAAEQAGKASDVYSDSTNVTQPRVQPRPEHALSMDENETPQLPQDPQWESASHKTAADGSQTIPVTLEGALSPGSVEQLKADKPQMEEDKVNIAAPALPTSGDKQQLISGAATVHSRLPQGPPPEEQTFREDDKTQTTTQATEEKPGQHLNNDGTMMPQLPHSSTAHDENKTLEGSDQPASSPSPIESGATVALGTRDHPVGMTSAETTSDSGPGSMLKTIDEAKGEEEPTAGDKVGSEATSATKVNTRPSSPTKPTITISTDAGATHDDQQKSDKQSTSGSTIGPNTPAFFTAPNTPAVGHDASSSDAGGTDISRVSSQDKKAEKPKGPAQTESLSLFGKKKEKKPKAPKKGTLKGKPSSISQHSTGVTEAVSDRAVSGSSTPALPARETAKAVADGNQSAAEKVEPAVPTKATKATKASKSDEIKVPKATDAPGSSAHASVEETPSKRKGNKIGNIFSSFFGGGAQSQAPAQDVTSIQSTAPNASLTDVTDQAHPPRSETRQSEDVPPASTGGDEEEARGTGQSEEEVEAASDPTRLSSPTANTANYVLVGGSDAQDDSAEVGLGISHTSAHSQETDSPKSKKKKKKKPKKTQHTAATDSAQGSTKEPEVSGPADEATATMFRFVSNEATSMTPTDDASQVSDSTLAQDTPPSASKSPAASALARVRALANSSNGHLVQSKQPAWKNKKRVPRPSEAVVEEEDEEERHVLTVIQQGSDTSEEVSTNGDATPSSEGGTKGQKLLLYIGPGRRRDMKDGDGELPTTKDGLRPLAEEELKREFGDASTSVQTSG